MNIFDYLHCQAVHLLQLLQKEKNIVCIYVCMHKYDFLGGECMDNIVRFRSPSHLQLTNG